MINKRPIVKNIFSIGSAKALSMVFPLMVLPYLINTIGIDQYGIIVFALAFVAYFNTLVDFSFSVTAVRSISRFQDDQIKIGKIVSEVISTKLLLLIISCLIGVAIIFIVPEFSDNRMIFLCVFSSLIGYTLSIDWFFTGIEKMEYSAVIMICSKVLHAISIFLFIKSPEDGWIYALIIATESLLVAVVGLMIMYIRFKVYWSPASWSRIKTVLTSNGALFFNQLLPNLYNNTTTLLLGFFGGPIATGTYGIIRKIINLGENTLRIVSNAFFPAINRDIKNSNAFRKIQWKITVIVIILVGVTAPFLPDLFTDIHERISFPLILMSFGLIGLTLYDIYGQNFLIVKGKDQLVLMNTLYLSFFGFLAALPAIYWGGLIGAVLVVSLTRIAIGTRLMVLSKSKGVE